MKKTSGFIAFLIAASLVLFAPSAAHAKPQLTKREAAATIHLVLRTYIGPAVGSTTKDPPRARVWGCERVAKNRVRCEGTVRLGVVRCKGIFVAVEYPKGYGAWPLRMECSTDR